MIINLSFLEATSSPSLHLFIRLSHHLVFPLFHFLLKLLAFVIPYVRLKYFPLFLFYFPVNSFDSSECSLEIVTVKLTVEII